MGRRSLTSGPDVAVCESQSVNHFSLFFVSVCLVRNTAGCCSLCIYRTPGSLGSLTHSKWEKLCLLMEGALGFHSSSPTIASPEGLAWKPVMGGQGPLEGVMGALLPHLAHGQPNINYALGCCSSQVCVFLGEKDYFLVRRMGSECQMREWVAGVISFHSYYLRADLFFILRSQSQTSPTPQYLQCSH